MYLDLLLHIEVWQIKLLLFLLNTQPYLFLLLNSYITLVYHILDTENVFLYASIKIHVLTILIHILNIHT